MPDQNEAIEATLEKTAEPTIESVVTDALEHLPIDVVVPAEECADEPGTLLVLDYKERHKAQIKLLATEVNQLPVITDTKARATNQAMKTRLVTMRNDLERTRLAIFKPVRALQAMVNEYLGTTPDAGLQGQLKELEDKISSKLSVWDQAEEDRRIAALNLIRERNAARAKALLDREFDFDGGMYRLTAPAGNASTVAITASITDADLRNHDDKAWDEFMAGPVTRVTKVLNEMHATTEERVKNLMDAGMTVNPSTGHLDIEDPEEQDTGGYYIVMREELDVWATAEFTKALTRVIQLKEEKDKRDAERDRRKKEDEAAHEQMRQRFAEVGRREKENDDARAAIDAEREALKFEKINSRAEQLEEIGIYPAEATEGVVFEIEGKAYPKHLLAEHTAITWQGIIGDAKADVLRRIERMKRMDERSSALMAIPGHSYDGDSVWTLGDATTTDHALATMDEEQWNAVYTQFVEASKNKIVGEHLVEKLADVTQNVDQRAAALIDSLNEEGTPLSDYEAPADETTIEGTVRLRVPDSTEGDQRSAVEKERMHAVLIDAEALLTSLEAAKEATGSAIARQTYERGHESTRLLVDNLRGTIQKDL